MPQWLLWVSLGTFQEQPEHDAFIAGSPEVPELRLNPSWEISAWMDLGEAWVSDNLVEAVISHVNMS